MRHALGAAAVLALGIATPSAHCQPAPPARPSSPAVKASHFKPPLSSATEHGRGAAKRCHPSPCLREPRR